MRRTSQPPRLAIVLFMLLAFFFQSYATQTHIHFEPDGITLAKVNIVSHPARKGAPSEDNPDNCPLCQLLYGGQYIAPTQLIFFLPMVAVSVIEAACRRSCHAHDAASHNWLGRAPPQA